VQGLLGLGGPRIARNQLLGGLGKFKIKIPKALKKIAKVGEKLVGGVAKNALRSVSGGLIDLNQQGGGGGTVQKQDAPAPAAQDKTMTYVLLGGLGLLLLSQLRGGRRK